MAKWLQQCFSIPFVDVVDTLVTKLFFSRWFQNSSHRLLYVTNYYNFDFRVLPFSLEEDRHVFLGIDVRKTAPFYKARSMDKFITATTLWRGAQRLLCGTTQIARGWHGAVRVVCSGFSRIQHCI